MMLVWTGMVVATDALNADKKVTILARTLADMTTQMVAVSNSDLQSIFLATESVLWPHPTTGLGMRVTGFDIDGAGKVFVDWSVVPSGAIKGSYSPMARCAQFSQLPAGLKIPRTYVVFAEVQMTYEASVATQLVNQLFKGSFAGVRSAWATRCICGRANPTRCSSTRRRPATARATLPDRFC